jgi:hypothetical protein
VGWDGSKDSVPLTGGLQLTEKSLVGDDLPLDGRRLLVVEDPPVEVQDFAIGEWKKTEIYRKSRELLVQQMRRKNPSVSEQEIEAEQQRGSRVAFKTWGYIERAIELDEKLLSDTADPLLKKIFYLLEKYGLPFLDKRIAVEQARLS